MGIYLGTPTSTDGIGADYSSATVASIFNKTITGTYTNSRVTLIGGRAFQLCSLLTAVSFPNVTLIEDHAFYSCPSLITISFPNVTNIENSAFYSCYSLTTASFPNVSYIGQYVFCNCSSLITASFPNVSYIGTSAFMSCKSLEAVSFPKISYIGNYAFYSCLKLIELNLTGVSSVPTLGGTGVFTSTPIGGYSTSAGQYGSVYVPASLYENFLVSTYWSNIYSRIISV